MFPENNNQFQVLFFSLAYTCVYVHVCIHACAPTLAQVCACGNIHTQHTHSHPMCQYLMRHS